MAINRTTTRRSSGQFRIIAVAALSLVTTLRGSIMRPGQQGERTLPGIPHFETRLFHPNPAAAANKSLVISVEFEMHPGDEGVLVMGGTELRTFSLDVRNGRVVWTYKYALEESVVTTSSESLPPGLISLRFELDSELGNNIDKRGTGKLYLNGKVVTAILGSGRAPALREAESLRSQFTGTIRRIDFEEKVVQ
jgi:hypothetical protein